MGQRVTDADIEELESLVREASVDGIYHHTHPREDVILRTRTRSGGSSTLWKVVALIFVGIILLFATDSIQIHRVVESGGDADHPKTDVHNFADDVETKAPRANATQQQQQPQQQPDASNNNPIPTTSTEPQNGGSAAEGTTGQENNDATTTTSTTRHTYRPRGRPMSEEDRQPMVDKWGSWKLVDDKERPTNDYYKTYPNRDVPRTEFPEKAWQLDKDYLSKFLPEGVSIVERAQEAILAEYGHTDGPWENRTEMFHVYMFDTLENGTKACGDCDKKGGWTTNKSWEGLKRRLLHAIMTEDYFVFAMGGHSAAAGHGNHFVQSYTLQVQWILEPIFARLGVRHQSRNFGNGGLGTAHNGMAAGSIYGPDVDVLMWDSGMTEKENKAKEMFARQGLLGGEKVPFLWAIPGINNELNLAADVDVGMPGSGHFGVEKAETYDDFESLPWAAQSLKCSQDIKSICKKNEYIGNCWVDRPDVTPPTAQKDVPGGQASWHPGNRKHQIAGRVLAFTLLQALKEVLSMWHEADGYQLADDVWHVTNYYQGMRTKVVAAEDKHCFNYGDFGLPFVCKYPMKARTEFTPRAYSPLTNIRTLMPPEMAANINPAAKNIYNPPDVFNPALHPPVGAIDVLSIVEAGVAFKSVLGPSSATEFYKKPSFASPPKVPVGKGVNLATHPGDDFCDGSVGSFCQKGSGENCLLSGHNDGRNGLVFDGFSGWIVMNLPDVEHGFIVIRIESWHQPGSASKTEGWASINNEGRRLQMSHNETNYEDFSFKTNTSIAELDRTSDSRVLKKQPPELCNEFHFEYAIDGNVTSLDVAEFKERNKKGKIQRVVETLVLLEDPNYTGGVEREVEVAVRIRGCGRHNTFKLSHIYWS